MIAVGIATVTPIANEVSQAEARFGANPSRAMVCTSDITNDIAMAMIAGIRIGAYLGSRRRAVALASPGGAGVMSSLLPRSAGAVAGDLGIDGCLRPGGLQLPSGLAGFRAGAARGDADVRCPAAD